MGRGGPKMELHIYVHISEKKAYLYTIRILHERYCSNYFTPASRLAKMIMSTIYCIAGKFGEN